MNRFIIAAAIALLACGSASAACRDDVKDLTARAAKVRDPGKRNAVMRELRDADRVGESDCMNKAVRARRALAKPTAAERQALDDAEKARKARREEPAYNNANPLEGFTIPAGRDAFRQ